MVQGFPDWTIIIDGKAIYLEIKNKKNAHKQPNQEYYISKLASYGAYAKFVYPEIEDEVIDEIQQIFRP